MTEPAAFPRTLFDRVVVEPQPPTQPDFDAQIAREPRADTPAHLRRQIVAYPSLQAPGTVVIDTANTYLYYVLGNGRAIRYGIGVGREGFTWSGVQAISRKQEWPDWRPPAEMIARQPYLPRYMTGGPGNPLGARALYLGNTLYRIHGTSEPHTIGHRVSSGCIRMLNDDVIDLYNRVSLGTKVVVLPDARRTAPAAASRALARNAAARALPNDAPPAVAMRRAAEPTERIPLATRAQLQPVPSSASLQSGLFASRLY
jgi:lipoprotein-anchoring transpeptidase ErfK/SrfK